MKGKRTWRGAAAFGVPVADVYGAFKDRSGLLLIERHGAGQYEVHPTNAGYRAMARAFEAAIADWPAGGRQPRRPSFRLSFPATPM